MKAFIAKKIEGQKKQKRSFKYDDHGRFTESLEEGYTSSMKYNETNQIVEIISGGGEFPITKVQLTYNEKKLPIKAVSKTFDLNDPGLVIITEERTYSYTFY